MIEIKVKRFRDGAVIPTKADPNSAGWDAYACLEADVVIRPGERVKIPTGLNVRIPQGYAIEVLPRSGIVINMGVTVANSPGLIDSSYDGDGPEFELGILLINHSNTPVIIKHGHRIAQLVIREVIQTQWTETQCENTDRNTDRIGGFGSSGK